MSRLVRSAWFWVAIAGLVLIVGAAFFALVLLAAPL